MIVCCKSPKDSPKKKKKILDAKSKYSKVTRYKISSQKSITFLHTNNEH